MSQHLFKKTLFEPISVCCWPRLLVKFDPNRSFFTFGPPFRPAFRASSLRGGGPKFLKICSKIHFLSNSRCNAGPDFWLKLIQIEASSLLGVSLAPLCGQNSIALASWDVSSVGGTPGVWCLNVIGRECWVWVVPCTGSWPGQPPPTKWGKEP